MVLANVLRLLGCCFLSMLFVLELFAWLWGFGLNLPLFIVCTIGLIVLLVYTTWDILSIKEDKEYFQYYNRTLREQADRDKYNIVTLQTELENADAIIQEYDKALRDLKEQLSSQEKDIQMLQEEIARLEGSNG